MLAIACLVFVRDVCKPDGCIPTWTGAGPFNPIYRDSAGTSWLLYALYG